jgi:hypothetical protein
MSKKAFSFIALLSAVLIVSSQSIAQTRSQELSAQSAKLRRGVHTTPAISRKCEDFASRQVRGGGAGDRSRHAVFMACVQRQQARRN